MRSVALLLPGQLGGFLSHHDGRSVGVARGEGREDPGEGTLRFRLCREPLRTALRWIARQEAFGGLALRAISFLIKLNQND